MASERQIDSLPVLLAVKTSRQSGPPLMRGLDIHMNSPVSVTKLTLILWVGFISSDVTADKLFPVNPSAIAGPPKMNLLLEAKRMPALIIKPGLILVTHTDDLGWFITSNQQGKMFVQNLNRIVCKPNVMPGQILYCTADCIPVDLMFQGNFSTNTQVFYRLSHRNDCRQRGVIWVTIGATTTTCTRSGTSVIRRSSVPSRAWVGTTTNWWQPETVAKSKASTQWRYVVVEPNHSWWLPFKSPTNTKETRVSSVCTIIWLLVNNQKSGHLGQGCSKDWTRKGSVSHHTP